MTSSVASLLFEWHFKGDHWYSYVHVYYTNVWHTFPTFVREFWVTSSRTRTNIYARLFGKLYLTIWHRNCRLTTICRLLLKFPLLLLSSLFSLCVCLGEAVQCKKIENYVNHTTSISERWVFNRHCLCIVMRDVVDIARVLFMYTRSAHKSNSNKQHCSLYYIY